MTAKHPPTTLAPADAASLTGAVVLAAFAALTPAAAAGPAAGAGGGLRRRRVASQPGDHGSRPLQIYLLLVGRGVSQ